MVHYFCVLTIGAFQALLKQIVQKKMLTATDFMSHGRVQEELYRTFAVVTAIEIKNGALKIAKKCFKEPTTGAVILTYFNAKYLSLIFFTEFINLYCHM